MEVWTKHPDETLDYLFDFSRWLPNGDTIASATSSLTTLYAASSSSPPAITQTITTTTTVTVWIDDGSDGDKVLVKVTVTTAGGLVKDASFILRIR